jgi:hypothetical protein
VELTPQQQAILDRGRQELQRQEMLDQGRALVEPAPGGASAPAGQFVPAGFADVPDVVKPDLRMDPTQEPASPPSAVQSFGVGASQGLTFGFSDEAYAAMRAAWDQRSNEDFVDAYYRELTRVRAGMDVARSANKAAFVGGEIAGGIATSAVTFGAGAPAAGASLGGTVARSAAMGAGFGGLYGAGTSESMDDLPLDVFLGAGLGAAAGAAVPLAVAGAQSVGRGVRAAVAPETATVGEIRRALARGEVTPQEIETALAEARQLGVPATIADVGGQPIRRLLERAAQSPGEGAARAERFLTHRNAQQMKRLSEDLVKGTGVPAKTVSEAVEQTMAAREKAAGPLYAKAYQFMAELDDDIVDAYKAAVKTPAGQDALAQARKISNAANLDDVPLMERIDLLKQGFDDVIGRAQRAGEKKLAAAVIKTRDDLIDLVDIRNGDYAAARATWKTGADYLDAIERGREILKPGFTAEQLKLEFGKLQGADQEAFRLGAVDAIVTRMRQQSAEQPNLLRIIRSPEMQDKITAIMDPAQAARFKRLVAIEEDMFRTSTGALRNSATAQRLAAMAEQEKQTRALAAIDMVLNMTLNGVKGVYTHVLTGLPRHARESILARQNAVLARRLLSQKTLDLSAPGVAAAAPGISPPATAAAVIGADAALHPAPTVEPEQ